MKETPHEIGTINVHQRYQSFDDLPLTLHVEDLMPILQIGRNTAYELVRTKQIHSVKIGRQLCIPKQALIEYLTSAPCHPQQGR